jgi:hypothetical protein
MKPERERQVHFSPRPSAVSRRSGRTFSTRVKVGPCKARWEVCRGRRRQGRAAPADRVRDTTGAKSMSVGRRWSARPGTPARSLRRRVHDTIGRSGMAMSSSGHVRELE